MLIHNAVGDDRVRGSFNYQLDGQIDEIVLIKKAPQHVCIDLHRINLWKSVLVRDRGHLMHPRLPDLQPARPR